MCFAGFELAGLFNIQGHPTDHFGKLSVRKAAKPLIPSDFLERIVTSNFRDVKNLMSVVFELLPKKGQLSFSERRQAGLKFSGNGQKSPNKFENNSGSPRISEQIKIKFCSAT